MAGGIEMITTLNINDETFSIAAGIIEYGSPIRNKIKWISENNKMNNEKWILMIDFDFRLCINIKIELSNKPIEIIEMKSSQISIFTF